MFNYLNPYVQLSPNHPLFRLELQRIRWLTRHGSLRQGGMRVIAIITLVLLGLWALAVFGGGPYQYTYWFSSRSSSALAIALLCSIAANVILDFACMIVTVNSFATDVIAGRWDLLRMTPVEPEAILEVKHTAAQLRVWRLMVAIVSTRLIVFILGALTMFSQIQEFGLRGDDYLFLFTLFIFAVVYVIEPTWRLRGITALGLAISSRVRNLVSISLAAIGAVGGVWLSQAMVIGFIFWTMILILRETSPQTTTYSVVLFFCIGTAVIIYVYYRLLSKLSMKYVMNRMDKMSG